MEAFASAALGELAGVDILLGRPGDPRDIAEAVAYLASDRAQWVSGAILNIDGGVHPVV